MPSSLSLPPPLLPVNRSMPECVVIPVLHYADVRAAAAWLCRAFGFAERLRIGDHRIQLVIGGGAIVVAQSPVATIAAASAHVIMLRVIDVNAHCVHARQGGATITRSPADYPYGERQYSAVDLGGHHWTFTQTIADVDPASWGGELL